MRGFHKIVSFCVSTGCPTCPLPLATGIHFIKAVADGNVMGVRKVVKQ